MLALYAQLRFHLDQIAIISRQMKTLIKPWSAVPELDIRKKAEEAHSNMIATRPRGGRYLSTNYDEDHPYQGALVCVDRTFVWAKERFPDYEPPCEIVSSDETPFEEAAEYYEKYHEPNPDASSVASSRSRYKIAFLAARIFWEGCALERVQVGTVKLFRDWLSGRNSMSPRGRILPAPPVKGANSDCETAQKANIVLSGLDLWGARCGNGWSTGFKVPVVYPVNLHCHSRSELFRILWALNMNHRYGREVENNPYVRYCPYEDKEFPYVELWKPTFSNKNARKMLGRLIVLRYHLATRSTDCHELGYAPSKENGHIERALVHATKTTDLARGFVRRPTVENGKKKKPVVDAKLPGKLASFVNSWWRNDQRDIKKGKIPHVEYLYIVRNKNGSKRGDYFGKFWNEAQAFAGLEPEFMHTLKKSGVTDYFYGGHSLEEIESYSGTSDQTLRRVYRLVKGLKTYDGPPWMVGPGEPPPFRAKLREEARKNGLPYPC